MHLQRYALATKRVEARCPPTRAFAQSSPDSADDFLTRLKIHHTLHLSGCEPPLRLLDKPARGPRPKRAVIANVPRPCEIRKDGGRSISLGCVGERRERATSERIIKRRSKAGQGEPAREARTEARRDHQRLSGIAMGFRLKFGSQVTCRCSGERATMETLSVLMSGCGGGEW